MDHNQQALRQSFCQRLITAIQGLASTNWDHKEPLLVHKLATLTQLKIYHQEFLRSVKSDHPLVVVVLDGCKQILMSDQSLTFSAGDIFMIPAHLPLDIANHPNPKSGKYAALVLELSDELLSRLRQAYPEVITSRSPVRTAIEPQQSQSRSQLSLDLAIPLHPTLAEAFLHLVQGLIDPSVNHSFLDEHRILEIVMLLLKSQSNGHVLAAIYPDLLTHLRHCIQIDLSGEWSATRLAQEVGISVSTLQRRLRSVNLSFRQLLESERMIKGMELLSQGEDNIAQIAAACGYASPSRFTARFRQHYAINPSEVRRGSRAYDSIRRSIDLISVVEAT